MKRSPYAVVDLFAGPGGLAEGFASVRHKEQKAYTIVLSIEKDEHAHKTLLLRSFLRQFEGELPSQYYEFINRGEKEPDWKTLYPAQWQSACEDALNLELGNEAHLKQIDGRLDEIRKTHGDRIVLIGGPPCQAYSLVGRSRNRGNKAYKPGDDKRHFLYQEYIRILKKLRPAAFVMENVKGLLSSSVDGEKIFELVLNDLKKAGSDGGGYRLLPLAPRSTPNETKDRKRNSSSDYIIRAEDFGVPQARHRVILVGIREDILGTISDSEIARVLPKRSRAKVAVRAVLRGMPRLRSGLSEVDDNEGAWKATVRDAIARVAEMNIQTDGADADRFRKLARQYIRKAKGSRLPTSRTKSDPVGIGKTCPKLLRSWILDTRLDRLPNCETRGHMKTDLARYFFVSCFGEAIGTSPKAEDFPAKLAPAHENWTSGNFSDRFRVQLWDHPSTTVTSHISKDGHYFIHPDPLQCRSLTVREAARLQTFPDNYLFKGNRTQQYVQVGNAVPPYLARVIGEALHKILAHSIEKAGKRRRKSRL
jgi:DNA (cytosine-5)-methyltransferase 1